MGYHFSTPQTSCACAPIVLHMHKKFELNRTKIKGGCQSCRKVVAHDSRSDLPLVALCLVIYIPHSEPEVSHKQRKMVFNKVFFVLVSVNKCIPLRNFILERQQITCVRRPKESFDLVSVKWMQGQQLSLPQ